ncbi:MAG: hypothetical protein J0L73_11480 [Verrucomicrobia bacterium]|nr:hypothetical protein [Verrucomicrobiota bacterium]
MHRTCSLLLLWAFATLAHAEEPAKSKAPAPDTPAPPTSVDLDTKARLMQKMDEIIISVHFEDSTLEQALEFLRKKSRELDKSSAPAGGKGVNIILREPKLPHESRITLDLKDVPFSEALRYVAELGEMVYRVDAEGVILTDRHAYERERRTRTFRVPPDFLSVGGSETQDASADPFATTAPAPTPVGKIPRKSVQQILEASGIPFPENSSASFNPLTGLLRVTNTQPNLDLVEAYCESICYNPPKIIAFNLTIIEAPGDLIHQINAEASQTADAGKQLATLLNLAQKPESFVHLAGHAFIETKSGCAVTTEALSEPWLSNSISPDLSSRLVEPSDRPSTGMRLKLEPTIQADGQTIDLSLDIELSPPLSVEHQVSNLVAPRTDETSPASATDFPSVHITSDLVVRSGATKLVGIIKPPGLQQKTDATLWAAFMTSSVRYVENPPHHLARGIPSASSPPNGLSSITFPIPAGLFESIMEPVPQPLRDWLIGQGVTFPSGAEIDLENNLLHVTNTQENIDSISMLIGAALEKAPKTVAVTLHTVRLPAAFLPKLSQAAQTSSDQSAEWKEVEAAAARGEAVFLESSFFETKSGTRSTHVATRECYLLDQTAPKDKSPPAISLKDQLLGSFLEIEPTIGADGRTLAVDYNHALHVPAGVGGAVAPDGPIQSQSPQPLRALKTHGYTTMHEGEIRLIALHQDLGSSHADHIWATFLQCCVVPHFLKPKHALTVTAPAPVNPDSQETRTYHPPHEIIYELRSATFPPPVAPAAMGTDPFGSPQETSPKMGTDPFGSYPEVFPKRQPTTNEVLEKLGLTFPKGSLSHFDSATSTLTVRNTPANHALIDAAIEKHMQSRPSTVAITTHVLQGPGPLLRRLAAQVSRKSDHRAEFDELLVAAKPGTVLHLDTARLETKPGTRAIVNQGSEHQYICELSLDAKGQPAFKQEPRSVGLNVELEPTTSKDSPFVNLILSAEYHTAPPLEHREHLTTPQGHRLEFPLTDYFTSKTTTAIPLPSGTTRLLSLYKPTGKPEFENEDILQAIFITCDVLRPDDPPGTN